MRAMQRRWGQAMGRGSWGEPGAGYRPSGGPAYASNPAQPWPPRWLRCFVGPATVTTSLPRHPEREEPTARCVVGHGAAGVPAPVATVTRWTAGARLTGTAGTEA